MTLACHNSDGHNLRISLTKAVGDSESSGFESFEFESFDSDSL